MLLLTTEVYHISVVVAIVLSKKEVCVLYEKFAELLDKNNKTAYAVSKETGIAQSVLSDWKNGRSNPKFDKLLILAKYFNVPVEYFAETEDGR